MRQAGMNGKEEGLKESRSQLPPHLVDELSSLLAEALILDLQAHSDFTANSPPGFDHNKSI